MKYHYRTGVVRHNYHIKPVIYITLATAITLMIIDLIFNYGKITIEILF